MHFYLNQPFAIFIIQNLCFCQKPTFNVYYYNILAKNKTEVIMNLAQGRTGWRHKTVKTTIVQA